MMELIANDCSYKDSSFPGPFRGKQEIERHFRLVADYQKSTTKGSVFVVDRQAIANDNSKIGLCYHVEDENGEEVPLSRHCAFFTVSDDGLIRSVFDNKEPANKTGPKDLAVISFVSKLVSPSTTDQDDDNAVPKEEITAINAKPTVPEEYFACWNRRDIKAAVDKFTDDCAYDDTVFPEPFDGKEALWKHLGYCAESVPSTFRFVADDVVDGGDSVGVVWHVENNGEELPFTRGCSVYEIDQRRRLMKFGIDTVEPAVFKTGPLNLFVDSVTAKVKDEPVRLIPIAVWAAYMYIVFFSDGILPGANALQLEQRTWEEVRDLSLNFFLVSPLLNLPFAPVVHPMLEGVFNILLAWAALFAGFFSDERKDKPNLLPLVPTVVGMQFLTSAFLLPYLATRANEQDGVVVTTNDLPTPARVVENRLFAPFLGIVGTGALAWGGLARTADFGGWNDRVTSFWDLMSIDRVGSSFLVDLAIFAAFQGWFVDDDLKRRGVAQDEMPVLRNAAKFVPFFGLVAYMTLRPSYND